MTLAEGRIKLNTFITARNEEILKDIPSESVDLIFTDPPYNVSKSSEVLSRKYYSGIRADINRDYGQWDYDFNPEFFIQESTRILNKQGSLIVWTPDRMIGEYMDLFSKNNLRYNQHLVWIKSNPLPNFRKVSHQGSTELMLWASKEKIRKNNLNFNFTIQSETRNYIIASTPQGNNRFHPTQKSLIVCEWIISHHCKPGGIVLDPFSGSGTIALASYSLGRNFIAIEAEEKYNKIAEKRIRQYQVKVEEETEVFEQVKMF